jgi:hypothetical protein
MSTIQTYEFRNVPLAMSLETLKIIRHGKERPPPNSNHVRRPPKGGRKKKLREEPSCHAFYSPLYFLCNRRNNSGQHNHLPNHAQFIVQPAYVIVRPRMQERNAKHRIARRGHWHSGLVFRSRTEDSRMRTIPNITKRDVPFAIRIPADSRHFMSS